MKAIIIGGGIGGLTTAIALEKIGIETTVFESRFSKHTTGAGIWMAPNAMQVFDRLGFAQEVIQEGTALEKVEIADHQFHTIQEVPQQLTLEHFGFTVTSILRARLRSILLKNYGKDLALGKHLHKIHQHDNSVQAVFGDQTRAVGDFLIGADGIHSMARHHVFPNSQLRYAGQTCWRGIANISLAPPYDKSCVETWGKKYRFGLSVISDTEVYWFAVAKAPLGETDKVADRKQKITDMFADFSQPIPSIIAATPENKIIRNDISDLKPIPTWHKGRVCLVGDAAHATTPNMGQGGGQAVEDAWFLSQILKEEKNIERAFEAFEKKRRKKVNQIVQGSRMIGQIAHISFGRRLRNALMRATPTSLGNKRMLDLYGIDY